MINRIKNKMNLEPEQETVLLMLTPAVAMVGALIGFVVVERTMTNHENNK